MREDQRAALFAGFTTSIAVLAVGVSANFFSDSEPSNRISEIVGGASLVIASIGVLFSAFTVRRIRQEEKRDAEALRSAQFQADRMTSAADTAGVDPFILYEEVLRDSRVPLEVRFIYAWSSFERVMRTKLQASRGDDLVGLPLGRLIREFADLVGLSNADKDAVQDLLRTRNVLIHGSTENRPSDQEVETGISRIKKYAAYATKDHE